MSRSITGKFRVHRYLASNASLRSYLPHTTSFNYSNLAKMFSRFSKLYIKPDVGSQGRGVKRVEKKGNNYIYQTTKKKSSFSSLSSLYQQLQKDINKRYIIQQGINLEKVRGNPYDIRAMVQRKPGGKWNCTGLFTKVGKPNKIVTNYYQGGKIYLLDAVFPKLKNHHITTSERKKLLTNTALKVAKDLSTKRSGMYEMGIDFAFDHNGKLWILEVNSNMPQFYPLRTIAPKMYRRMITYARSYGRKKA